LGLLHLFEGINEGAYVSHLLFVERAKKSFGMGGVDSLMKATAGYTSVSSG
jgi:hypothetical protein